jgi:hypothetical protein
VICSRNAKKLWDSESANKVLNHLKSDKMRKLVSDRNKILMSDPVYKNRWLATINRDAISSCSKAMWSEPGFREKIKRPFSDRCKKQWDDPNYRAKIEKYRATDVYRRKMDELRHSEKFRERMNEVWSDPEYREKMSKIRLLNLQKMLKGPSTQQNILYSILDDLNIEYKKEITIGFYQIDCRIDLQPSVDLIRPLLIEVQGDYWHSLPKTVSKDKSKSTYLKTYYSEFDLKYLWEHEFNFKDRIIETLKYWLGLSKIEVINFDFNFIKMSIVEAKEAELFVSKYHYAGRIGRSGINLGFYLGDVLIAVCIYSIPVRQEVALKQGYKFSGVLELSRFCIHPKYQVKNFASYLIAKSIGYVKQSRLEVKCLVSFADSTYNHLGTIYKASNWRLDGEVSPDYWYADNRGYICHKKTLWNKAKQMSMMETEYCNKFGYSKVWGGKKFRYVYDLVR